MVLSITNWWDPILSIVVIVLWAALLVLPVLWLRESLKSANNKYKALRIGASFISTGVFLSIFWALPLVDYMKGWSGSQDNVVSLGMILLIPPILWIIVSLKNGDVVKLGPQRGI